MKSLAPFALTLLAAASLSACANHDELHANYEARIAEAEARAQRAEAMAEAAMKTSQDAAEKNSRMFDASQRK